MQKVKNRDCKSKLSLSSWDATAFHADPDSVLLVALPRRVARKDRLFCWLPLQLQDHPFKLLLHLISQTQGMDCHQNMSCFKNQPALMIPKSNSPDQSVCVLKRELPLDLS